MKIDSSTIKKQLAEWGMTYLRGHYDEQNFAAICGELGDTIAVLDVKKDASRSELVFGSGAIDFHTDSPAADFIAWLCIKQDECRELGSMEFVDTFPIQDNLSESDRSVLSRITIQRRIKDTSRTECSAILRFEEGDGLQWWLIYAGFLAFQLPLTFVNLISKSILQNQGHWVKLSRIDMTVCWAVVMPMVLIGNLIDSPWISWGAYAVMTVLTWAWLNRTLAIQKA